jgi:O-antigen/teichoic acid export membrane protein
MQIMAVLAVIQAYVSPVGQLFKSLDRPRWLLWWSVGITAAVAVLLTLGVKLDGVRGAVWGITAAYALGTLVIVRATTVLIRFGVADLWRTCGKPVAAAAAMAGVVFLVDHLHAQPSWWKTAAIMLVPLGAYCWVLFTLDQSLFATVATQLRSRR